MPGLACHAISRAVEAGSSAEGHERRRQPRRGDRLACPCRDHRPPVLRRGSVRVSLFDGRNRRRASASCFAASSARSRSCRSACGRARARSSSTCASFAGSIRWSGPLGQSSRPGDRRAPGLSHRHRRLFQVGARPRRQGDRLGRRGAGKAYRRTSAASASLSSRCGSITPGATGPEPRPELCALRHASAPRRDPCRIRVYNRGQGHRGLEEGDRGCRSGAS